MKKTIKQDARNYMDMMVSVNPTLSMSDIRNEIKVYLMHSTRGYTEATAKAYAREILKETR
jgi:hypothetical protein